MTACVVCHSPRRPLTSNESRYGAVPFHADCEARLFADRFVAAIVAPREREATSRSWLEGGFVP